MISKLKCSGRPNKLERCTTYGAAVVVVAGRKKDVGDGDFLDNNGLLSNETGDSQTLMAIKSRNIGKLVVPFSKRFAN